MCKSRVNQFLQKLREIIFITTHTQSCYEKFRENDSLFSQKFYDLFVLFQMISRKKIKNKTIQQIDEKPGKTEIFLNQNLI